MTFVGCERLKCVQKERFENLYRAGARVEYKSQDSAADETLEVYKSVGDDIEDFFQRNKLGNITANEEKPIRHVGQKMKDNALYIMKRI